MNQVAFQSIIDSIKSIQTCDYCKDSSLEDSFSNVEEAKKLYHEALCDTCFHEHKLHDSFNV